MLVTPSTGLKGNTGKPSGPSIPRTMRRCSWESVEKSRICKRISVLFNDANPTIYDTIHQTQSCTNMLRKRTPSLGLGILETRDERTLTRRQNSLFCDRSEFPNATEDVGDAWEEIGDRGNPKWPFSGSLLMFRPETNRNPQHSILGTPASPMGQRQSPRF